MKLAHIHHRKQLEPVWHVQLAVLAAIALQLALANELNFGPKYLIAGFELVLMVLLVAAPKTGDAAWRLKRGAAILLIALVSLANIASLILVVYSLFAGSTASGRQLIASGMAIYFTNIIVFGLWYWEMDSGGVQGQSPDVAPMDFLFPQMTPGEHVIEPGQWAPTFFDYFYISITNATAFSPTDCYPLTHRAKALMSVQSLISLITVALVAARAVSILG